jgi:flavin-dependent dehydrogenase
VTDRGVAVVVPGGGGLTLVGAFPSKAWLADFADDRVLAVERFVTALPDAPDLTRAERVSKATGTNDYPFVRRDPTPRPGLALIGDAAMASDPVPAVGCGWAFRTAEWLADATVPALVAGADLDQAMRSYRRARRLAERYDALARRDARGLPPNRIQRLILDAAPHDPEIARRFALFGNRAAPASVLLNPGTVVRAIRANRRGRQSPTATTEPTAVVSANQLQH